MKRVLFLLAVSACGPARESKTVTQPDRVATACGGDAVVKQSGHSFLASDLEGLPIVRIDVSGNRLVPATTIAGGSGLEVGKPLSHEGVARAIRQLYEVGQLDDVEVFVQQDGAGALVTLVVRERPRIAEIFAPGIPETRKLEMAKWLGIEPGKPFDVAEVQTQRRTIAAGMAEKGASLDVRVHVLRDNQVDVCILVRK